MLKLKLPSRALAAFFLFCSVGVSQASAKEAVLVTDGEVEVSQADVTSYIELRFSDGQKENLIRDESAIRDVVASIFVTRRVASNMRNEGLDADARWTSQFMGDRGLFLLKINRVMQEAASKAELKTLAKEYYLAHPDEFQKGARIRASHILISTDDRDESDAESLATDILRQVESEPGRFEGLAGEYSDDEASAEKGGDLGFFARGRMVKSFEDAAFALDDPGQIAGPVKTRFGYHIIRLEEYRPESKQAFEEVEARLIEQARKRVEQRAKEEYLGEIRSSDSIESDQEAITALVKNLPDPDKALGQEGASSVVE